MRASNRGLCVLIVKLTGDTKPLAPGLSKIPADSLAHLTNPSPLSLAANALRTQRRWQNFTMHQHEDTILVRLHCQRRVRSHPWYGYSQKGTRFGASDWTDTSTGISETAFDFSGSCTAETLNLRWNRLVVCMRAPAAQRQILPVTSVSRGISGMPCPLNAVAEISGSGPTMSHIKSSAANEDMLSAVRSK